MTQRTPARTALSRPVPLGTGQAGGLPGLPSCRRSREGWVLKSASRALYPQLWGEGKFQNTGQLLTASSQCLTRTSECRVPLVLTLRENARGREPGEKPQPGLCRERQPAAAGPPARSGGSHWGAAAPGPTPGPAGENSRLRGAEEAGPGGSAVWGCPCRENLNPASVFEWLAESFSLPGCGFDVSLRVTDNGRRASLVASGRPGSSEGQRNPAARFQDGVCGRLPRFIG